jgi:hypothetical protein
MGAPLSGVISRRDDFVGGTSKERLWKKPRERFTNLDLICPTMRFA